MAAAGGPEGLGAVGSVEPVGGGRHRGGGGGSLRPSCSVGLRGGAGPAQRPLSPLSLTAARGGLDARGQRGAHSGCSGARARLPQGAALLAEALVALRCSARLPLPAVGECGCPLCAREAGRRRRESPRPSTRVRVAVPGLHGGGGHGRTEVLRGLRQTRHGRLQEVQGEDREGDGAHWEDRSQPFHGVWRGYEGMVPRQVHV